MSEFVKVATLSSLEDPGRTVVEIGDRVVVLLRVGDSLHCLEDVCTHDGGPLSEGRLDGNEIICPRHGARFDVRTGKALKMPATENTAIHEVKLDGDDIYVRLTD